VIGFALLSLALFALAFDEFTDRPMRGERPPSDAKPRRGGAILVLLSLLSLGTLWAVSRELGWQRDRVLWVGFGLFLTGMTLARPWWFWESYKARWLRDLIGDEATAGFYLVVASLMVWVGLFTDWTFGRQ
jgi:hypothetical protein